MDKYLIIETSGDGGPIGFTTNNLNKDFIKRYGITWHEDSDSSDFDMPEIEDIRVKSSDVYVAIFYLRKGERYEGSKSANFLRCAGEFNLYTESYHDDLMDFIQEHWWDIELGVSESKSVKKFEDFK